MGKMGKKPLQTFAIVLGESASTCWDILSRERPYRYQDLMSGR